METMQMLNYLSDLAKNNNLAWYQKHKVVNQEATTTFELIVWELLQRIGKLENEPMYQIPKELIFRLSRDIRFSVNKQPYNPAFRAHISPFGKAFIPLGYYLCIMPGDESLVAAGLHSSNLKEATDRVRNYITEHGTEFENIVSDETFTKHFVVMGEKLINVPKGYDTHHPQAEYLKHKSLFAQSKIPDKTILENEHFLDIIMEKYRILKPFKDYLNKSLNGYQIPKR